MKYMKHNMTIKYMIANVVNVGMPPVLGDIDRKIKVIFSAYCNNSTQVPLLESL